MPTNKAEGVGMRKLPDKTLKEALQVLTTSRR